MQINMLVLKSSLTKKKIKYLMKLIAVPKRKILIMMSFYVTLICIFK